MAKPLPRWQMDKLKPRPKTLITYRDVLTPVSRSDPRYTNPTAVPGNKLAILDGHKLRLFYIILRGNGYTLAEIAQSSQIHELRATKTAALSALEIKLG